MHDDARPSHELAATLATGWRRLAFTLALAALGLLAGALTAHVAHAQLSPSALDSIARADSIQTARWRDEAIASGRCRWAAASEWPASGPLTTVLLDSAGIRVTVPWSGAGNTDALGRHFMCMRSDVLYDFARGFASHALGDPPFIGLKPDSLSATFSCSRAGVFCSPWPDSVTVDSLHRAGVWGDWRRTTAVLAARYHVAAPPASAPTPPPVGAPDADPCAGALGAFLDAPDVRGHDVERRDEARVVSKAGACVAVVALMRTSVGDRYVVRYPPCPGPSPQPWRLFGTTYTTRTSALDRAARGAPACPAVRTPDARNLPALPFSRRS